MNPPDLQPGQRRVFPVWRRKGDPLPKFLWCRCDHASLATPLPAPIRGSFCKLCNIPSK